MTLRLRPETIADHGPVRDLHRRAFGGPKVPALVDALRAAKAALAPLSVVAEQGEGSRATSC